MKQASGDPVRRVGLWLLGGYLLLLLASHVVQRRVADPPLDQAYARRFVTRQDEHGRRRGPGVGIAYMHATPGRPLNVPPDAARYRRPRRAPARTEPATTPEDQQREPAPARPAGPLAADPLPILLLHGNPGSAADFLDLVPRLAVRREVIAPDMPGFGQSREPLPDYGAQSQARYALALMDVLEIERFHVLGYDAGGAASLYLADLAPDRIASVTLYGANTLQKYEGSGDYQFERFKWTVGYAGLVMGAELVPHFGYLGSYLQRQAQVLNRAQTDLRPLEAMLPSLKMPLLILHGRTDRHVRPTVARLNHQLVPHSELVMFDGGHNMLFDGQQAARLAQEILPFIRRYDAAGVPPRRRSVDPATTEAAVDPQAVDMDRRLDRLTGPWTRMLGIGLLTSISEDLTCIAVGLLINRGELDFFVGLMGCFLGIYLGDLGLFLMGRIFGRHVLSWAWVNRQLPAHRLEKLGGWFNRHGWAAVLASRFLPGTRIPVYIAAGVVGKQAWRFMLWSLIAAVTWVPLLIYMVSRFGQRIVDPIEAYLGTGWLALGAAAVVLLVLLHSSMMLLTQDGRHRLAAKIGRLRRFEFWPAWLFYLPVVPWITLLALRYRGLATLASVNPGVDGGGLLNESKYEMLTQLDPAYTAQSVLVPVGPLQARVAAVRQAMAEHNWTLPIILKPDSSHHGRGLKLIESMDQIEKYLDRYAPAVIAQDYHPGPHETAVYYYRYPDQPRGEIFSMTDKYFPFVTGDGTSTLQELIWAHPRVRLQATRFLTRHVEQLDLVVPRGERFRLLVAGSHVQGAIFIDGAHLVTPALRERIDAIAQQFAGFYVGRFDLRYADVEALKEGSGFKVIELSGVTSQSTNIYDPTWSIFRAYRVLYRQWLLLMQIGYANRQRGHEPRLVRTTLRRVVRRFRQRWASPVSD